MVLDCPSGTTDCKEKREFFAIPKSVDSKQRQNRWLERINRYDLTPDEDYFLCDRHFTDSDFEPPTGATKQRSLNVFAVPKYHMKPGEDTDIPVPLDRNTRHKRAREKQEAKRFSPSKKKRELPPSWYNYSKLALLPWNCQLNPENARVLDISLNEIPKWCLGRRRITCTNKIKTWNGKIQVEMYHIVRTGRESVKEKLIVQKADLPDNCLVWRQEVQPTKGNVSMVPFQHVDVEEDPLAISNFDHSRVKTEVFDDERSAEGVKIGPTMDISNEDKSDMIIKEEPLEIIATKDMDLDHGLGICIREMGEKADIKPELTDFNTEVFGLK